MSQTLKISDSRAARWAVLSVVSLTMMCGYFINDVMAPLKSLLGEMLGWDNTDFGLFNSGYGWFNVILLMLILGGVVLDRMGARFTGMLATGVMLAGAAIKYYAIGWLPSDTMVEFWFFGEQTMKLQVLVAALGYAVFAVGYESIGITATKIVVRWFRGREMALALGMNVAFARVGTFLAMAVPLPIANYFGSVSMPLLFCMGLLLIGFLSFMVFVVMDRKLDRQEGIDPASHRSGTLAADEKFVLGDLFSVFRLRGFWYIAILCLLFYAAVSPFLKFAAEFVMSKFGVSSDYSGLVPSLLPVGTLLLTPLFGSIYDTRGRGATMMIIGSLMLVGIYAVFALPFEMHWWVAVAMVIILGVAFSLVPSAMWPSVPKIIPERHLGTAYALIFWVQNWGLAGVPLIIGWSLDRWGGTPADGVGYDYTAPMLIFMALGVLAVIFALMLKREDRIKGYGLERPNIEKG